MLVCMLSLQDLHCQSLFVVVHVHATVILMYTNLLLIVVMYSDTRNGVFQSICLKSFCLIVFAASILLYVLDIMVSCT